MLKKIAFLTAFVSIVSISALAKGNIGLNEQTFRMLSSTEISAEDFAEFSKADLRILRNAIFAKYGYKFKSADLKKYFSKFGWYSPEMDNVTSLLSAVENKNISILSALEKGERPAPKSSGQLFKAIAENDVASVKKILSKNKSAVQEKCLITAQSNTCFFDYKAREEAISFAELEEADSVRYTPLYFAVGFGNVEIVKALLDAGAKADETSNDIMLARAPEAGAEYYQGYSMSPLEEVSDSLVKISSSQRSLIASMLLKHGAKPDAKYVEIFVEDVNLSDEQTLSLMKDFFKAGLKKLPVYYKPNFDERHESDEMFWYGNLYSVANKAVECQKPKTAQFLKKMGAKMVIKTTAVSSEFTCCDPEASVGSEKCYADFPKGVLKATLDDGSEISIPWELQRGFCFN